MTNLEKASFEACAEALRPGGFVARRRGLLLKPGADKDVTGWLGLNVATWSMPKKLLVNPVVGIRHVPVEKLEVELAGRRAPLASIARPLGYLMPENSFRQWEFVAGTELRETAEALAESVAEYGGPFIEKWSDWGTFSAELAESGLLLDNEQWFVLPIVAVINGDRELAHGLVQRELNRLGEAEDVYAMSYRRFAAKFATKYLPTETA